MTTSDIRTRTGFSARDYHQLPAAMIVESDGVMVQVTVGLNDAQGRQVTRVDLTIEDEQRGGDAQGRLWVQDGARLVRLHPGEHALPGVAVPHPPLTAAAVTHLSALVEAVKHTARVGFILPGLTSPVSGQLRHIVRADNDNFLTGKDDLRDGRVRITADLGADYYLPVTEVIARMDTAEFVIHA